MARFAEIIDGVVIRVVVVHDDITHLDGVEDEQRGIDFLATGWPTEGEWVQTWPNPLSLPEKRYNSAGIGGLYDAANGAFHDEQPYSSWALDTDIFIWRPPTPYPEDGKLYSWDEATTAWVEAPPLPADA
tara:strand:- start:37 stop:426 length:390 start_codon:yes stop_codon:yes gene_type:complete